MRMKADVAWEALEERVRGVDPEYRAVAVTPLIAAMPLVEGDPVASAVHASLADRSCILPAEVGWLCRWTTTLLRASSQGLSFQPCLPRVVQAGLQPPQVVVGT